MNGLILVDKPKGISSFGVVSRIRGTIKSQIGQKLKVGHSGTLDPTATGLLVIAIGKYTKRLPELIKQDKTYEVEMVLGKTSTTGDSEGEITEISDKLDLRRTSFSSEISGIDSEAFLSDGEVAVATSTVEKELMDDSGSSEETGILCKSSEIPLLDDITLALAGFEGDIMQTPPKYSALKINGQRAYKLAREGKEVKMEPREAHINSLKLIDYSYPKVQFIADVASGTYIRSLVEDIGKKLCAGAYMSNLNRTRVGKYDIKKAMTFDNLDYSKIENAVFTLES